jgi:hypothetical protein
MSTERKNMVSGGRFSWDFEIDLRHHEVGKLGDLAKLVLAGAFCKEVIDLWQSNGTCFMQRFTEDEIL